MEKTIFDRQRTKNTKLATAPYYLRSLVVREIPFLYQLHCNIKVRVWLQIVPFFSFAYILYENIETLTFNLLVHNIFLLFGKKSLPNNFWLISSKKLNWNYPNNRGLLQKASLHFEFSRSLHKCLVCVSLETCLENFKVSCEPLEKQHVY